MQPRTNTCRSVLRGPKAVAEGGVAFLQCWMSCCASSNASPDAAPQTFLTYFVRALAAKASPLAFVTTKAAVEFRAFSCAIKAVASLLSLRRCRTRRRRETVSAAVAAAAHNLAAASCRLVMLGCTACLAKILHAQPTAAGAEPISTQSCLVWQSQSLEARQKSCRKTAC